MWGQNEHGQLGDGTTSTPKSTPQLVTALDSVKVVSIALGCHHSGALTGDPYKSYFLPNCCSVNQTHVPHCVA